MHAFLSDSLKIINTQQFLKAMKVRKVQFMRIDYKKASKVLTDISHN